MPQVCQQLEEPPGVCWALHSEQLQLPAASTELLQGLASLPLYYGDEDMSAWAATHLDIEADRQDADEVTGPSPEYMADPQPFARGGFGEVWRAESQPPGHSKMHMPHAHALFVLP